MSGASPSGAAPLRVAIVDDHPLVLEGLVGSIGSSGHVDVVAATSTVSALIERISATQASPDVVVLDLHLQFGVDGAEAVRLLRELGLVVLVISYSDVGSDVVAAMQAGAAGYITKHERPETVLHAIDVVASGGTYLAPSLADHVSDEEAASSGTAYGFSEAEIAVINGVADGLTDRQIAAALGKSVKTVQNQMASIATKIRSQPGRDVDRKRRSLLADVASELGLDARPD